MRRLWLVACGVIFSWFLYADDNNSVCMPLLTEAVGIARNVSDDADYLVHTSIPQALDVLRSFTQQLKDTTDTIGSKTSLGFFAAAGAVAATSVTFVALAAILVWKCAGERISNIHGAIVRRSVAQFIEQQQQQQQQLTAHSPGRDTN